MKKLYFRTIFYFLKPYKLLFMSILLLGISVALLESLGLAALFPVFNSMLGISPASSEKILFLFIERSFMTLSIEDKLVASFTLLIILILIRSMLGILAECLNAFTSGRIMYETKKKVLEKYTNAPYQFFLDTKQGELLYNVFNAPQRLAYILYRIPRLILESLKVIAIILLLMYMNIYVTVILILLSFGFNIVINLLSNRFSYVLGKERLDLSSQQTSLVNEIFNGIKQITVCGAKNDWNSKFNKANRRFTNIFIKDISWVAVPKYIIDVFGYLAMFSVVVFVKKYYPEKFMESLPVIGVFAMGLVRMLPSLGNIGRLRMEIVGALPDAETIYKALNAKFQHIEFGDNIFEGFHNTIALENVYFAHKGREDLLKGVNIVFRKNEVTAIVGATGSGKTTIVNLLLGLLQPTSGKIIIDRVNLKEYKIETYLEKIGFVSQDPFIFHSTIEENITFGSEKFTREDAIKAAELCGADAFIKTFPDGYNTIVGERGMKLSGGQQQCIAIARAIIRKPQILILDEATSALDSISEKMVQRAINNISKDHTVIVIAHRLSTIQNADKIIVLKNGQVVEEGNHAELLGVKNYYWYLYSSQQA